MRERLSRSGSSSSQEAFVTASLLAEAMLKWCTTTAISLLAADDASRATRLGREVASASGIGTWESALAQATERLHRSPTAGAREFAKGISDRKREAEHADASIVRAAVELRRVIEILGERTFPAVDRRGHRLRDVFSDTVFIRNRTRGHGAHLPDFFDRATPHFVAAVEHLASSLPAAATWWTATADGTVIELSGDSPSRQRTLFPLPEIAPGRAVVLIDGMSTPLAPLCQVSVDGGQVSVSFANGRWKPTSAVCEFLNYASGDVSHEHIQEYADPRLDLPPSETSAASTLTWQAACAHNLPPAPNDYVSRPELEDRLRELVTDPRHRIITLHGGGGMGKTALTLHVLRELVERGEDFGFDCVLWFSARDIDLLTHGPRARKRDIADLEAMAVEFTRLIGEPPSSVELSQERFRSAIGAAEPSEPRYLLILDNLETFDSIVQIQHFLDQHVTLPSKVILTSRHDDFQGDYRLPVGGLTKEQASTLLVQESRRLYCEPKMTAQVQERLFTATGGRAYALKLSAAQIAKGTSVDEIVRASLNREDILAALFDRSFELLSPDGAFLFLLLGLLKRRTSELTIRATFSGTRKDYEEARGSLEKVALLVQESDDGGVTLTLPEMALQYATRRLKSHPDAIEFRHIGENVREWATPVSGQSASEAFLDRLARALERAQQNSQDVEELLDIMEAAGEQDPSLLSSIAGHYVRLGIEFDRTESAFRRAVEEAAPDNAAIWRQWAEYARGQRDMENEVLRRIRAVEIDDSSSEECSHVAYLLSLFLRDHKNDYPVIRRAFLFRSVRTALERHRGLGKLTATDLSRLGWLYLNEVHGGNPDPILASRAYECARDGLRLEPGNVHCQGLQSRSGRALRGAGTPLPD